MAARRPLESCNLGSNPSSAAHMQKLNAKKLRKVKPSKEKLGGIKRNPIYFVLSDVLDTYNIGSMFRLADAVGATKIYLCGETPKPPNLRIHKSAIGLENWVPWEKKETTIEVIRELKEKGVEIIAIEQSEKAIPYTSIKPHFPIALILGHETTGISKDVLKEVDKIAEIQMHGVNISFNVWGSAAVVAYKLLESLA